MRIFVPVDTTDVVSALVSSSPNQTTVVCFFLEGTRARGCVVSIETYEKLSHHMLPRLNGTAMGVVISTGSPSNCYNVSVMDWEEDGSTGSLDVPIIIVSSEGMQSNLRRMSWLHLQKKNASNQFLIFN